MSETVSRDIERLRDAARTALYVHRRFFLAQGIVMMLLGLLAVALPHISTLAIELIVGWLFFVGGMFRFLTVIRARRVPGFWWSLLTALVAIAIGVLLILQPEQGVLTLTLALALIFTFEGVAAILTALEFRRHLRNWGWTLFSGIVDLVLAFLIWTGLPEIAEWVVGLLVGINMFFLGLGLTMTALAARTMKSA